MVLVLVVDGSCPANISKPVYFEPAVHSGKHAPLLSPALLSCCHVKQQQHGSEIDLNYQSRVLSDAAGRE